GLVKMIAQVALKVGANADAIKAAKAGNITGTEAIADTGAKGGENMTGRRAAGLNVERGGGASQVRNTGRGGRGKIGPAGAVCWSGWSRRARPRNSRNLAARSRCTSQPQVRSPLIRPASTLPSWRASKAYLLTNFAPRESPQP